MSLSTSIKYRYFEYLQIAVLLGMFLGMATQSHAQETEGSIAYLDQFLLENEEIITAIDSMISPEVARYECTGTIVCNYKGGSISYLCTQGDADPNACSAFCPPEAHVLGTKYKLVSQTGSCSWEIATK